MFGLWILKLQYNLEVFFTSGTHSIKFLFRYNLIEQYLFSHEQYLFSTPYHQPLLSYIQKLPYYLD